MFLAALPALGRGISLHQLRPAEQHLVQFLLLLPLAALIVSIFRTVIGVVTFGTFGPALLGLAFLDLKALRWGLPIFAVLVLVGWGMRHLLDRFHLLLVPRIAALLTLIIVLLIVMIVVANHYGAVGIQYVSLFPLVILTHMVERFWTVEAEDGTPASFKTLLGTLLVAVTVSLALSPEAVGRWMFAHPETLGLALAAEFILGRYTGYRLTDLGIDMVPDRRQGPLLLEANARPGLAIQIANGQGLLPRLETIDRARNGEQRSVVNGA